MSHKCEAAMIACEDFRLHRRKDGRNYIAELIKDLNIDCDLITRAGGVQDLVRPEQAEFRNSLLRDAAVSAELHTAAVIYLVNHEDCGAYGKMEFSSREDELKQHYCDLEDAKKILAEKFPGIEVKKYFFELEAGSHDVFVAKEII